MGAAPDDEAHQLAVEPFQPVADPLVRRRWRSPPAIHPACGRRSGRGARPRSRAQRSAARAWRRPESPPLPRARSRAARNRARRRAGPARRRSGRAPPAAHRRAAAGGRVPVGRGSATAPPRCWEPARRMGIPRVRPCIFIYHSNVVGRPARDRGSRALRARRPDPGGGLGRSGLDGAAARPVGSARAAGDRAGGRGGRSWVAPGRGRGGGAGGRAGGGAGAAVLARRRAGAARAGARLAAGRSAPGAAGRAGRAGRRAGPSPGRAGTQRRRSGRNGAVPDRARHRAAWAPRHSVSTRSVRAAAARRAACRDRTLSRPAQHSVRHGSVERRPAVHPGAHPPPDPAAAGLREPAHQPGADRVGPGSPRRDGAARFGRARRCDALDPRPDRSGSSGPGSYDWAGGTLRVEELGGPSAPNGGRAGFDADRLGWPLLVRAAAGRAIACGRAAAQAAGRSPT